MRDEEEKIERKKDAAKERVEAAKKDLDNFKVTFYIFFLTTAELTELINFVSTS